MKLPERSPFLDAMLAAELDRRLAERARLRSARAVAASKGWATRVHSTFQRDALVREMRA